MSDDEFVAELHRHQAPRWRRPKLPEHTKKHRPEFEAHFGRALFPSEVDVFVRSVLRDWERIFTGLERDGAITYAFVGSAAGGRTMIVVVTRGGLIRSLSLPTALTGWVERNPELIEATARARNSAY